jgi:hypothetical protein
MLTQRNCLGLGMNVNDQTEIQEYLQCFKETPTLDTDYNFSGGFFEFASSTHHVVSNVDKSGYNVSPEPKLEPETNLGQVKPLPGLGLGPQEMRACKTLLTMLEQRPGRDWEEHVA